MSKFNTFIVSWLMPLLSVFALLCSGYLWVRLTSLEELLAKQSLQANTQSLAAQVSAQDAQELARTSAAKLALLDVKISEIALQRTQLEQILQSLSRTRDDAILSEIETTLRIAQQQAHSMGSVQPLLLALKSSQQRLAKSSLQRLAPLERAMNQDLERIKSKPQLDIPVLLEKLNHLIQQINALPLLRDSFTEIAANPSTKSAMVDQSSTPKEPSFAQNIRGQTPQWIDALSEHIWTAIKSLIRITPIAQPEAVLLAPEQGYFLKENLKLRLLNAKLELLSHQFSAFTSDINQSENDMNKYFATNSVSGSAASHLLKEIKLLGVDAELPQLQASWAAIGSLNIMNTAH